VEDSNGHGPTCLQRVSVPVFVAYGTADKGCFPSMAHALYDAARHSDKDILAVDGAGHYFDGAPQLVDETLATLIKWLG
jgi:fermentation-respiration switch protein FrsA (DUF1100 family)